MSTVVYNGYKCEIPDDLGAGFGEVSLDDPCHFRGQRPQLPLPPNKEFFVEKPTIDQAEAALKDILQSELSLSA